VILVDTSIWVSHFRSGDDRLRELLEEAKVISHPYIIGELACGNLDNRREILSLLQTLPAAVLAAHDEVLLLIEEQRLAGLGLGYVDVHLLASARLSGAPLWTNDKRLKAAASRLRVCFKSA
jgi:predicted nucleic acid-binding protein